MPRSRRRNTRPRVLQTAAFVWTMWRWLPPSQKRRALLLAGRHGPWIVSGVLKHRRPRRR
jgi:hypothetical protein